MKFRTAEEAARPLFPHLRKANGRFTVADAAAATGLALEEAFEALELLMGRYRCRLQMTADGAILYDFGGKLQRRGRKTIREMLIDVGIRAWKVFASFFKVWITVMLVVYFVVFVILVLALLFATQGRDGKRSVNLRWIGDLFADVFWVGGRGMVIIHTSDRDGYRYRGYGQHTRRDPGKLEQQKRLVQSVYDFVLGPPRQTFDPFANEKEVLAWLRQNKGLLTPTELVALAGWTYHQAEERMADYLTRFRGRPDITDDGVLVGTFDQVLAKGDSELEGGKVELFWDEYEAPYEITGNTSGRNAAIIGMNAFNLLVSGAVVLSPSLQWTITELLWDYVSGAGAIAAFLGWIPFLFSLTFFAVPGIRSAVVRKLEKGRVLRNKTRRIIRVIFEHHDSGMTADEIIRAVNSDGKKPMPDAEIRSLLDRIAPELQGVTVLQEDGTVEYQFDRIRNEKQSVQRLRDARQLPAGDTIIFDTGAIE